ncbi:MAG: pseudouridine synthase [Hyphomicrobiaceae bacterium]|nr:pseudouridine synthase [Hyphomicrobiaceae bacterium]
MRKPFEPGGRKGPRPVGGRPSKPAPGGIKAESPKTGGPNSAGPRSGGPPSADRRQSGKPRHAAPATMDHPASHAGRKSRAAARQEASQRPDEPMRIAKAMARAGLCSRREAERWIADGRVNVNGTVLKTPAVEISPKDKVLVDGRPLPMAEPVKLWRYHKPRGLVTTHADPEGRPTVFENLPDDLPRVISIGRLDFNTEGLLLLTNDGALARHLELPATGWLRRYRVRAHGRITQADLDKLKDGIEIEGVRYGPVEATLDSLQGANIWLTLALREGKNREVRRILESLGLEVNRLIRVSYGPFQLLELKPGETEQVKRRVLADQLGTAIADELGLTGPEPDLQTTHRWRAESAAVRLGKPIEQPVAKTRPPRARQARDFDDERRPAQPGRPGSRGDAPRGGSPRGSGSKDTSRGGGAKSWGAAPDKTGGIRPERGQADRPSQERDRRPHGTAGGKGSPKGSGRNTGAGTEGGDFKGGASKREPGRRFADAPTARAKSAPPKHAPRPHSRGPRRGDK